jgi:hypothetical protein
VGIFQEFFGTSQEASWRRLADALGGSYDERFWTGPIVAVKHFQWTIELDTTAIEKFMYTRLRAYFNCDDFRFEMNHVGCDLWHLFGPVQPRIKIGDEAFDAEHVIRGNDKSRMSRLFANREIRDLIAMHTNLNLGVRAARGWFWRTPPVAELYAHAPGVITDLESLKSLFYLHCELLNLLCRMGAILRSKPGVPL